MLYFIPAWYHGNDWKEFEQVWYLPKKHSEFDETVKQVQLFNRRQIMP
ncbi:MAG: accessory Sec system glycosyltransferase Asp1, partial [Eubacterium sp.]|nr:accessory Sec system glycosyltransferase Asp1 [Eubacterium sp.]